MTSACVLQYVSDHHRACLAVECMRHQKNVVYDLDTNALECLRIRRECGVRPWSGYAGIIS
jgi:hypothetical protein